MEVEEGLLGKSPRQYAQTSFHLDGGGARCFINTGAKSFPFHCETPLPNYAPTFSIYFSPGVI